MGLKPTDEGWQQLKTPEGRAKAIMQKIDKTNTILEETNTLLKKHFEDFADDGKRNYSNRNKKR